jgi:hypothetical protein
MDIITDRHGVSYTVTRTPWGDKVTIYHVHSGCALVARAVLRGDQVREVLVYRVRDRQAQPSTRSWHRRAVLSAAVQASSVPLRSFVLSQAQARNAAFLQALQQLGWVVGQNVHIDYRWSASNIDDTRRSAVELVALGPDVILTAGGAGRGRGHGWLGSKRSRREARVPRLSGRHDRREAVAFGPKR